MEREPLDRYERARTLVRTAEPEVLRTGIAGVLDRVCTAATGEVRLFGASVHLMSGAGHEGVAACSDQRALEWGEVAFTAGEGPCLDAWRNRGPVLVPDLAAQQERWPGYSTTLLGSGVGCVLAFPLSIGEVDLGVLEGYDAPRCSVDTGTTGMMSAFARVATEALLDGPAADGSMVNGSSASQLSAALEHRIEIHQAQGMVMVSLGVTLPDALVRMRAHAFASDVPLLVLAQDVVTRRADPREWTT
ncbi:MAG: GAF and ANTAR domain-containing protein [Nocardioides sp.]